MSAPVLTKSFSEPPISKKEILRYAGCREADGNIEALIAESVEEARKVLSYKVCCRELSAEELAPFLQRSRDLSKNLAGSDGAILFAATVGVGIDRLIAKYGIISPAKALIMQAIGAERIEALCNEFCGSLSSELGVLAMPRFSAGYGDLPIEAQRDIFDILDCPRKLGLTLNEGLIMSPAKSVTAFVGFRKNF